MKKFMIGNAIYKLCTAGVKASAQGWISLAISATVNKKEEVFVAVLKTSTLTPRKVMTAVARGQAMSSCCVLVKDGELTDDPNDALWDGCNFALGGSE
jgi:LDH2 family malate/lactate/ureidoglycolate dehydrogenase